MAEKKTMNIYEKLIEVRKEVSYLKKDNAGFQFKYVSSSQTLGALRSKMDEMGLLLVPRVIKTSVKDHTTAKGKHEYFTELHMFFTWVNAENPEETIKCPWYGQGLDDGEKGPGKAMTYAEKFFLLKFFNIATDKDDPDANQRPLETKQQTKTKGTPQGKGDQDSFTSAMKAYAKSMGQDVYFGHMRQLGYAGATDIPAEDREKILAYFDEEARKGAENS